MQTHFAANGGADFSASKKASKLASGALAGTSHPDDRT